MPIVGKRKFNSCYHPLKNASMGHKLVEVFEISTVAMCGYLVLILLNCLVIKIIIIPML